MSNTDRKAFERFLSGLSPSRRASIEKEILEDSNPESQDQNLPESYYGLPPKGVQAGRKHSDSKILREVLASLPTSRRASMEALLLEDADPESLDQNLPDFYYGFEPRGVQAGIQDRALRDAIGVWKHDMLAPGVPTKHKGQEVIAVKTKWTSGTPDFTSIINRINQRFFAGSGYAVEAVGLPIDIRQPPKPNHSEKNFSYQPYVIVSTDEGRGVQAGIRLASEITGLEAIILEFIVDSGQGFTASEISGELGVSLDKVQRSLSKIEDAGYIQSRAGSYFAVAGKRLASTSKKQGLP